MSDATHTKPVVAVTIRWPAPRDYGTGDAVTEKEWIAGITRHALEGAGAWLDGKSAYTEPVVTVEYEEPDA